MMGLKRKDLVVVTNCQVVDASQPWREICVRLSEAIGEQNAYAWFGHCRFIERTGERLELAQWNSFAASECLKRYGAELAKAAGVKEIRVYRNGGFLPTCILNQPKQRRGYETYRVNGADMVSS